MATNIYVQKKSDVTRLMNEYTEHGYSCYRTRLECECNKGQNRRSGAIVINVVGIHDFNIIRCKGCEKGGKL